MDRQRRHLLKASAVTALSYSRIMGANEKIRFGLLGAGGRGRYIMDLVLKQPDTQCVALNDVAEPPIAAAKKMLNADAAPVFADHRELLDRKDIDAVVIGSPDHWHVPMTIDAVKAGKDVYVEKPVSHGIEEHAPLIKAVRDTKRVVQVGYQQRSWEHFQDAARLIQSGKLGQITQVNTYWYQNYVNRKRAGAVPPPAPNTDWKRFHGPTPVPAQSWPRQFLWRWFWDYGGGHLTDLFSHWLDFAHMALQVDTPQSAMANGGVFCMKEFGIECPDTITASFLYPNDLNITYLGSLNNGFEDGGLVFRGTDYVMKINRLGYQIFDQGTYGRWDNPVATMRTVKEGAISHVENFLACMKSRKDPNSTVESACASARVSHLGNMAYRKGQVVTWPLPR